MTKGKYILLSIIAIAIAFGARAQKLTFTKFDASNLTAQMQEYLDQGNIDKDQKKKNDALMREFAPVYQQLSSDLQDSVVEMANVMMKLKMRPLPDVANFLTVFDAFYNSSSDRSNFHAWIDALRYLQRRNKKIKDFTDFVDFTQGLLADRTLTKTRSAMWQVQAGVPFELRYQGSDITIEFPRPCELYYSSDKDNGTIFGTTGIYYYFDNKWKGRGGRLNWDRTGIPASACWAVLGPYEANTKFPKFTADSVQFTNTNYFQKPIYGRVEEALANPMEPEKYAFPKFRSYQTDFQLKDILPGVDYSGSFMMNGSKFITSDTKHPATLIFYRGQKQFITVQSTKFTITSNKVVSENAAVKIFIESDSICNNGITVRYVATDKQVSLVNPSNRNYYSPYSNSYHNLDMYCENIVWKMDDDILDFSMLGQSGDQTFSTFESANYYSEQKFREIQGIDEINPVVRVFRYMKSRDMVYDFYIDEFAQAIHLDIIQAKSMVHNLAKSGLVSFNESESRVYVKDKLVDYYRAYSKDTINDYDALSFESSSKNTNARLDLSTNNLSMSGVEKFIVSDSQQVAIYPRNGDILIKKNRDIQFSGRIDAGKFIAYVTGATFYYEDFKMDLPKVDSMMFYVTMFNNPNKEHIVYTPLYNLVGDLQIDKSTNHNGLKKTKDYPIFTSKEDSYVYYDRHDIHNGTYIRDKFYYTIHPFVVKNMDDFKTDSLSFNGVLTSAGIFPDITEPLRVQKDYSLGFTVQTPKGGYPAYGGKGRFTSTIDLSYHGLRGAGQLDYLTSVTKSNNMYFMPDSMVSVTDTFYVVEKGIYPDIRNGRTVQRWYPQADSMRIAQELKGTLFKMYHNDAQLAGQVILKPEGTYAQGTAIIKEGTLESDRFTLQPKDLASNVSTFTLESETYHNIAFYATNLKSKVDFEHRRGDFLSNAELGRTTLPLLQYAAYVDKFSWEMDKKQLDLMNSKRMESQGLEGLTLRERFAHPNQPGAFFVSTDPIKDSLSFYAIRSTYYYNDAQLDCRQTFLLKVADVAIAPSGDTLHIRKNGTMDLLKKSQILASTANRYHLIYDADVLVETSRSYSAKGYIDYVDRDQHKSKIFLAEIAPNSAGTTIGTGAVSADSKFALSSAFGFVGGVTVQADQEHFYFDGGISLTHSCTSDDQKGLLAFKGFVNPEMIAVFVPELPTDLNGNRITASILFNPTSLQPRAAFLTNERAADNELLGANGMLIYDDENHRYLITTPRKIENPEYADNYLTLDAQTCLVEGEGNLNFGVKQDHVKLFAYGKASLSAKATSAEPELRTVFGFQFPIDEKVLGAMAQFIADDLRLSPANPDNEVLRDALVHSMGMEDGEATYSAYKSVGFYDHIPKAMHTTLLFEDLPWSYSPALGYYYSGTASLACVGEKQLHLPMRVKAQFAHRGSSTNLILYLQVAADHWYYFNYDFNAQQLYIQSSVGEWVDMIKALPADKRQVSGRGDVGTYRYRITPSRTEVANFLLRMEGQQEGEDEYEDDVIEGDDE